MIKCKICRAVASERFRKCLLFKYDIAYYQCAACSFLFTEDPYWLNEAYQEDLTGIRDIGMVQRNLLVSETTARLILAHFNPAGKFIDYGAGTGLLVRLMRDKGFDFYYDDPFARNIFARCFEAKPDSSNPGQYELLTAFEVFEHSPDPMDDVRRMLTYSDSILFSTQLQPRRPEDLENWYYISPDTGTHVAFYTANALKEVACQLNLRFYSNGDSVHVLTRRAISLRPSELNLFHRDLITRGADWTKRKLRRLMGVPKPMTSLTGSDVSYVNKFLRG